MKPLNIFYSEPNPDRWFPYDRFLRKLIRRIVRGKRRIGGQEMVASNLIQGLDKLKIPYRFNDYAYIKKHPNETIGIIGKSNVLFDGTWKNPILFGASVFAHPLDCPNLFEKYPNVKKILVPGEWMKKMFEPYYENKVIAWPVGIDTEKWHVGIKEKDQPIDFLIYYKIRWDHDKYDKILIKPLLDVLKKNKLEIQIIKYGFYEHNDLIKLLGKSKAVIFLCEHETQGLAYQQILATGTPILAWNKGGYWVDPTYYPQQIKFQTVSSVPYWDERCGEQFVNELDFEKKLHIFLKKTKKNIYDPRNYILDNLTLEKSAQAYLEIYNSINHTS